MSKTETIENVHQLDSMSNLDGFFLMKNKNIKITHSDYVNNETILFQTQMNTY